MTIGDVQDNASAWCSTQKAIYLRGKRPQLISDANLVQHRQPAGLNEQAGTDRAE